MTQLHHAAVRLSTRTTGALLRRAPLGLCRSTSTKLPCTLHHSALTLGTRHALNTFAAAHVAEMTTPPQRQAPSNPPSIVSNPVPSTASTVPHSPSTSSSSSYQTHANGDIEWMSTSTRPRIVVLGTGWGSVSFLKSLDINKYEIVVISPRNYFLFTPLLPSACTGTLEMGSLTEPIRQILLGRHATETNQYIEASAIGLHREERKVRCVDSNGREFLIEYDHLLIGVGAVNNTFNTPGVEEHAFFLKEAKHARMIRAKILDHFERALSPTLTIAEKEALLQFVVVGGGPTGVEFAGELVDFIDSDLKKQFPSLVPLVRVRLLQGQDHILNTYDEAVSRYAERTFRKMRIEVITGAQVKSLTANSLTYIEAATKRTVTLPFSVCLWSTGIAMTDFVKSVSHSIAGQDSHKGLVTDSQLRLLDEIPLLDRTAAQRIVDKATKVASGDNLTPASPAADAATTPSTPIDAQDVLQDLSVDPRVYAFGDCATTHIPKLASRIAPIFAAADVNQDGLLSYGELKNMADAIAARVPVLSGQLSLIMSQYAEKGQEYNLEQLTTMFEYADKSVRAYPATAQVASQQGKYLAKRFNAFAQQQAKKGAMIDVGGADHRYVQQRALPRSQLVDGAYHRPLHPPITSEPTNPATDASPTSRPFRYRHMGSLAYVGHERAAIDLGRGAVWTGVTAFWLYKSIYFSKAVSTRTRLLLAWDWCRTWFFGRDTSKP